LSKTTRTDQKEKPPLWAVDSRLQRAALKPKAGKKYIEIAKKRRSSATRANSRPTSKVLQLVSIHKRTRRSVVEREKREGKERRKKEREREREKSQPDDQKGGTRETAQGIGWGTRLVRLVRLMHSGRGGHEKRFLRTPMCKKKTPKSPHASSNTLHIQGRHRLGNSTATV
jgi:hypothetical protein